MLHFLFFTRYTYRIIKVGGGDFWQQHKIYLQNQQKVGFVDMRASFLGYNKFFYWSEIKDLTAVFNLITTQFKQNVKDKIKIKKSNTS